MASTADDKQAKHSANIRRLSGQLLTRGVSTIKPDSLSLSKGVDKFTSNNKNGGIHYKQQIDNVVKREIENIDDGHVRVAVRCRPMSEKELAANYVSIVEFESDKRLVVHDVSDSPSDQLGTRSGERRNFSNVYDFDIVFDDQATQQDVYDKACRPIVESSLEGYNGTIFAYGQTGTGKTYTMEGVSSNLRVHKSYVSKKPRSASDKRKNSGSMTEASKRPTSNEQSHTIRSSLLSDDHKHESAGIIPRSFQQIFQHVARNSDTQFLIRASYVEIYQEEIRDLLRRDKSTQKLELHERSDIGVYVKDLTSFVCKSISEIERVMRVGNQNRMVGATDMNEHSSRSHAIFMITIEQQPLRQQTQESSSGQPITTLRGPARAVKSRRGVASVMANSSSTDNNNSQYQQVIRVGKLNLVDLAGSERQRKTNSFGQRQMESIKINLSLSALGNVINSLMKVQQKQQSNNSAIIHTPYRDSKLTRLLQDSLGGNAKTLMIANIGPASYNYDETINTLNYASRARCIKNKPRLNEDPKDALLRELQHEIDLLRMKLANSNESASSYAKQLTKQSNENVDSFSSSLQSRSMVEMELHQLKQKLASLEGKLLNGYTSVDQNLLKGLTQEQEDELKRQHGEIESQASREKAIRDELERRVEAELVVRQSFATIQQEVDAKRRLIKQILFKIKNIRDEIDDTQQALRVELDELEQLHHVLQRELKLKCLIMDNFIPNCHVDKLLPKIIYDEQRNVCQIEQSATMPQVGCCVALARNNNENLSEFWQPTYDSIRPRSEFERISDAIYPSNIRYKYEYLIEPKLELPNEYCSRRRSLTKRKSGEAMEALNDQKRDTTTTTPRLQALIDQALNEREPDIVI